jgi:poly [ADP-ribose] polymerase
MTPGGVVSFSDITNKQVKELLDTLQGYAKRSIQTNYTVSAESVTEAQVSAAQALVDEISALVKIGTKADSINSLLLKLYTIIPRQMKHVQDHLFGNITNQATLKEAEQKIDAEQSVLDAMAGQVALNKKKGATTAAQASVLDAMGLEIEEASASDVAKIKKMMGPNANQFKRAFKVVNKKTEVAFKTRLASAKDKSVELLWHGSRNENWFNILGTGLLIRPSGAVHTGSMFGDGIYGANKAQKSIGYTSYSGSYWANGKDKKAYLALFDFHVGKQKVLTSACSSMSERKLKSEGYDSVYAQAGYSLRNDEFIVYNTSAVTVRFIIEIG